MTVNVNAKLNGPSQIQNQNVLKICTLNEFLEPGWRFLFNPLYAALQGFNFLGEN